MSETRLALPQRSPRPFIVPCTCTQPRSSASSEFATASSASLWQWMPSGVPVTAPWAASTAGPICAGSDPPRVSHRQTRVAPASAAAAIAASA